MMLSKPMKTDDDADQAFKLMFLPDHARKMVILNMGAVQMYLISSCSSKMKNLLRKYVSHIQFTLRIEIKKPIVFIIKADSVELGSFEVESLDAEITPKLFASDSFDKLTTFCNDVFHGASEVYKDLLDRFPCQTRLCKLPFKEDSFDIRKVIEWTNTLSPKLTDVMVVIPKNASEQRYSYVIKSLEQLNSVDIHFNSKQHFSTVDIDMKGKRFFVLCAIWVTLDFLFKCDSVVLYLSDVRLTDAEIKTFFNAYIRNETSPNLEHLTLRLNRPVDVHSMFDGLVWSRVEAKDARKLGNNGLLAQLTNAGFLRIIMKNREICYVWFDNFDEKGELCICNFKDEVFQPFKLMKLPSLALEEVIKNMSLMEAFNFSFCSPTLRHFVKQLLKNQKVNLSIEIADGISFRLKYPNGHSVFFDVCEYPEDLAEVDVCRRMKIGNASRIPFYYEEPETNILVTYWRDILEGVTEFYPLIFELFKIHFEKLAVWKEKINYDYGSVVGWINRMNRPIEDVYFDNGHVDDTLYQQTIQSQKFRKCKIWQKPSKNFTSPEFRFTAAQVIWVIYDASWITLENLSDIGSVCLRLYDVKLTDQELNSLFKNLIAGKFLNLELMSLKVNGRAISKSVLMDGIADLENNEENWDVRVFDRYGYNIHVQGTTDVQMATGEMCSFEFRTLRDGDEVYSEVYAFIWK